MRDGKKLPGRGGKRTISGGVTSSGRGTGERSKDNEQVLAATWSQPLLPGIVHTPNTAATGCKPEKGKPGENYNG